MAKSEKSPHERRVSAAHLRKAAQIAVKASRKTGTPVSPQVEKIASGAA